MFARRDDELCRRSNKQVDIARSAVPQLADGVIIYIIHPTVYMTHMYMNAEDLEGRVEIFLSADADEAVLVGQLREYADLVAVLKCCADRH